MIYKRDSAQSLRIIELTCQVDHLKDQLEDRNKRVMDLMSQVNESDSAIRMVLRGLPQFLTYSGVDSFPVKKELILQLAKSINEQDMIERLEE